MLQSSISMVMVVLMLAKLEAHILPHLVRSSSSSSSSSSHPSASPQVSVPAQRNITFPPEHCREDEDCIGTNGTTSRLYYDPNGRCDRERGVCICLEGFKRLEFRVKPKRSYKLTSNVMASDAQPNVESYKYITKCVAEDETLATYGSSSGDASASSSSGSPSSGGFGSDDLNLFLRGLQYYGQICDEDKQCAANLICRQLLPPSRVNVTNFANDPNGSNGNGNATSQLTRFLVNRVKRCRCSIAMHFNKHTRRCEFPYSNTFNNLLPGSRLYREDGSLGSLHKGGDAGNGGGLLGLGSFPSSVQIHSSSIDWKIFEIVLELAFLIACLLGYKACSRMCCRDDNGNDNSSLTYGFTTSDTKVASASGDSGTGLDDDRSSTSGSDAGDSPSRNVKSDEESIIGGSSHLALSRKSTPIKITMTSVAGVGAAGSSKRKVSPRLARRRKMSRFYARARRCTSPYNLGSAAIFAGDSSFANGSSSSTSGCVEGSAGSQFRRLSSVSATMSRSSSASTRNLLVKVNPDDIKRLSVSTTLAPNYSPTRVTTPCYTCRIYKEVYSPSARCKSCRSSLLSIEDQASPGEPRPTTGSAASFMEQFDSLLALDRESVSNTDLASMVSLSSAAGAEKARGASNLMLSLPPRHKQIRRSEEVGVPPHLRAPYRDTTPFWLK